MGIAIRKDPGPVRVVIGDPGDHPVTFLVSAMTFTRRASIRARLRKAGNGVVDEEGYARALHKAILEGWEGLRYEDTGGEVPFGPCPACLPPRAADAPSCPDCGGSGDCRDWALARFPDAIWDRLALEASRALSREEALLGN